MTGFPPEKALNKAVKFLPVDRSARNVKRIVQHIRISHVKFTEHLPDLVVTQVCVRCFGNYDDFDASLEIIEKQIL